MSLGERKQETHNRRVYIGILIEREMCDVANAVEAMEPGPELDRSLLEQHEEQISGLKTKLADVSHNIAIFDGDETSLADRRSSILKAIFSTCLQIQRLLKRIAQAPHQQEVIKLPNTNVPTFKRDFMEWWTFWEQLDDFVHSKPQLSNPSNWLTFDRLSRMAQLDVPSVRNGKWLLWSYRNATERYNRPQILHQAHVCMILEVSSLNDESGKELRGLHDILVQDPRVLKVMDCKLSPFLFHH